MILVIGVPITIHAHRLHKAREQPAIQWLDELQAELTDGFVGDLKRDHAQEKADGNGRIPISATAQKLFDDPRIKAGYSLRFFVPVNQPKHLFLWGNDHFDYCDIRELGREYSYQIDQDFIDDLIASGGTHQTGLYSILWSPYLAGRVIKDTAGQVKAICVINAPR